MDIGQQIASELRLRKEQVDETLELLREGNTSAFMARYRKERTGGLDEETIREISRRRGQLTELAARKEAVLRNIREQGKLTEDLEQAIRMAAHLQLVEDHYLPFRPRRHTAGTAALDRGLGPLAELIMGGGPGGVALESLAANYIDHGREVHTTEDALAGASHIIAEQYSTSARLRQKVRDVVWSQGVLRCSAGTVAGDRVKEFRDYFTFAEAIRDLPPHRVLAVNRGERKKALKVVIEAPGEVLRTECAAAFIEAGHPLREFLSQCLDDALSRLVMPAICREVRRELTERAERHAVEVFASNLRSILTTPPVRGVRVLAIDPGFRTGCKVTAIDAEGNLLGETIVYPHEPQERWAESKAALLEAVRRYGIDVVAIGNGTGCHATEKLIAELIAENELAVRYALVSEAGTTAYAASSLAREEFGNLDASVRGTVSIGRRLQDPLSEFVKVDPRSVGVGLYQHDIDQKLLVERLREIVYTCVNEVGVDVNRAHVLLLEKVSGLSAGTARNIVARRRAGGPLRSREELREVPGVDENAFRQCAGFLKVFGGDNPLDRTEVHPESYEAAMRIIDRFGYKLSDLSRPEGLPGLRRKLERLSLEELAAELSVGIPTLSDVLGCLEHPERDVRDRGAPPILRREMMELEDLKPGMWLKGTVRNVVDFGAFVDVGLKEDGLVHISQLSSRYIKSPLDFVQVGQTVEVRVISIDKDRRRIALSMIREPSGPGHPPDSDQS